MLIKILSLLEKQYCMNFKLQYSLILVLWFFYANSYSQDNDSLFNKARFYYENDEYQMAIPYFSKYIQYNPNEFKAYKLRGNCFLETGQNNMAIEDYLVALELNKESDLIYNLGIAYEKIGKVDSSIYYFRFFVNMEPKLADGYIRLCILFMYGHPEWGDSAIYYASRAVNIEPENPGILNYLAMAFYSNNEYKKALETSLAGLRIDSSFSLLNRSAGISSFFLKDYSSAIAYFDKAYRNNPNDLSILDYKIQSLLFQNTSPEQILFQPGSRISLHNFTSEKVNKNEQEILKNSGKYDYKMLKQKIQTSALSMSLDDFFMLYISYSLQPGYSPFYNPNPDKTAEKNFMKEVIYLEELLLNNPTDFPFYLNLAEVYLEMGNEKKYFENRFKYFGFTESIKATGDGLTAATAYIVNDIDHEQRIMQSLGYRTKGQSRVQQKKHTYDILTGTDQNNIGVTIYFNIDRPLSTLPKKAKH